MLTSRVWLEHSEQHMLVHLLQKFLKKCDSNRGSTCMAFREVPQNKSAVDVGIPWAAIWPCFFLLTLRKNLTNSNFNRVNEYLDKDFDYDFDDDYVEIDRNMKLTEIWWKNWQMCVAMWYPERCDTDLVLKSFIHMAKHWNWALAKLLAEQIWKQISAKKKLVKREF